MKNELVGSELESRRFGLKIARCRSQNFDAKSFAKEVFDQRLDLAILRVPSDEVARTTKLSELGLAPKQVDTLVYYECPLDSSNKLELRNADLHFRPATIGDSAALEQLVRVCFADYRSHYHGNTRLNRDAILEGYVEWAMGHIATGGKVETHLALRRDRLIAFACCRDHPLANHGEGVLYGVHPDHAGGGVYADLIRYTRSKFAQRGRARMVVSTQITNLAVQKVWTREGFHLSASWATFHVQPLLSAAPPVVDRALLFTRQQVEAFGDLSGDLNPVHFSHEAAQKSGFEESISHGMLAGAEMSRIIGTEVPGHGTLFLRTEMVFLGPIYPDRHYRMQLRFPDGIPARGRCTAIFTIEDPIGQLSLYARSELLRR